MWPKTARGPRATASTHLSLGNRLFGPPSSFPQPSLSLLSLRSEAEGAIEPLPGQMTYIELGGGRPNNRQNVTETARSPPGDPDPRVPRHLPYAVALTPRGFRHSDALFGTNSETPNSWQVNLLSPC